MSSACVPSNADELVGRLAKHHRSAFHELVCGTFDDDAVRRAIARVEASGAIDETSVSRVRFALLRFLVDSERSGGPWQALSELDPKLDRDRLVEALWERVEREDLTRLADDVWPRAYYQDRLFAWFLSRFDPQTARRVFGRGWLVDHAHVLLLGLVAAALVASGRWGWARQGLWGLIVVAYGSVLVLLAGRLRAGGGHRRVERFGEALLRGAQSLVPRLGGAVAVGLLGAASVSGLAGWGALGGGRYVTALVLVAVLVFLMVQLGRNVDPGPAALWRRWWVVASCGVAHALSVAAVGLALARQIRGLAPPGPAEICSWAVWSLAVGTLLNVIWDETPLTKPL